MSGIIIIFGVFVAFIAGLGASSYDINKHRPVIILPTYRLPPQDRPVIRTVRSAGDEPYRLYKSDDVIRAPATANHPILPTIIDDTKLDSNKRYARSANPDDAPSFFVEEATTALMGDENIEANKRFIRSLDSPSGKRYGGGRSRPNGSRNPGSTPPGYNRRITRGINLTSSPDVASPILDYENVNLSRMTRSANSPSAESNSRSSGGIRNTGPTHQGYKRRNAREIPFITYDPFNPPRYPSPFDPFGPRPQPQPQPSPFPIYARARRDVHDSLFKKATHRDIIIPNWNPNARVNPWQRIGGKRGNLMC